MKKLIVSTALAVAFMSAGAFAANPGCVKYKANWANAPTQSCDIASGAGGGDFQKAADHCRKPSA